MPTLANIQGSSLAPDLTQALNLALNTFGTPQSREDRQRRIASEDAASQAAQAQAATQSAAVGTLTGQASTPKQKQDALIRLGTVNPQAASGIQRVLSEGRTAELAVIQQEVDKGARRATIIKGKGSFKDKQRALADMAANAAGRGEDLTRLIELSNMSEGQLDVELDKMLLQATDIKTLTKPAAGFTLSEGQTRFGAGGEEIASVEPEATETFSIVKNAQGKGVAQRSNKSGKLFPLPDTGKAKKPKFENFVDAEGGIVAFDTNTNEGAALAQNLIESGGRKALSTDAVPTVDQGKNAGFAIRSESANDIIEELGTNFTGFASIGQRLAPNFVKSAERQQFEQAERNMVNAVLRKESGAVISDAEFDNARQQYIPQPGDSADVVAQKAGNRRQIIAGMRASAGKGALKSARSELQSLEGAAGGDTQQTQQTVTIGNQTVPVGQIITNSSGQKGRVEADGTITIIE